MGDCSFYHHHNSLYYTQSQVEAMLAKIELTLASQDEVNAGVVTDKAISPATLMGRKAFGCSVIRGTSLTLTSSAWNYPNFSAYLQNPNSLTWWDSSTAIYAPSDGWYQCAFTAYVTSTANLANIYVCLYTSTGKYPAFVYREPGYKSFITTVSTPYYFLKDQYVVGAIHPISSGTITLSAQAYSPILSLVKL